jgi:hypothetical protein
MEMVCRGGYRDGQGCCKAVGNRSEVALESTVAALGLTLTLHLNTTHRHEAPARLNVVVLNKLLMISTQIPLNAPVLVFRDAVSLCGIRKGNKVYSTKSRDHFVVCP